MNPPQGSPPSKRPRLGQRAALSAPFKSPLRRDLSAPPAPAKPRSSLIDNSSGNSCSQTFTAIVIPEKRDQPDAEPIAKHSDQSSFHTKQSFDESKTDLIAFANGNRVEDNALASYKNQITNSQLKETEKPDRDPKYSCTSKTSSKPGSVSQELQHSQPTLFSSPPRPSSSSCSAITTATIQALRREHTAIINRNRQLRADLDVVEQAVRIRKSPRDAELGRLIALWREASRAAAEELFSVAKDRVNGMGGLVGWKERERGRKKRFDEAWGGGDGGGIDDGDLSEGEKERLRAEREEGLDEGSAKGKEVWEEVEDGEAFTMDMMLRSMNIELDLIGYDKDQQRWVE